MKIFLLLLLPCVSLAQEKGGYATVRGGVSLYRGSNYFTGRVSVGVLKNNTFGIGGGFGLIKFDRPYIPLTIDFTFFGAPDKVTPIIIGQAGYGIYNDNLAYTTQRGGFTGGFSGGISFPAGKKNKIYVTGGISVYSFTTHTQVGGSTKKARTSVSHLEITGGLKF